MGKSRRNRAGAAQRRDPITKPAKPPSDPELVKLRDAKILPIVNQLKSADPKARSSAASAISNVIQDARCRKLLLREQIVHTVLTQTLTDYALESRAAGWTILQVLAQEEEPDFCVHLFRSDILTAVEFASRNISDKLTAKEPDFRKLPKAEQAFSLRIVGSLLSLLTSLAEAQDDILEAISAKPAIFQLLNALVMQDGLAIDGEDSVRSDTLACLMVLAEDNATLADAFLTENNEDVTEKLMQLKDQADGEGVLACTVLSAIFSTISGSKRLSKGVQVDHSVLLPTLSTVVASIQPEQPASNNSGWSSPAEYQQLALETIGDIGSLLNTTSEPAGKFAKSNGRDIENNDDMQDEDEDFVESVHEAPEGDDDDDDEMDEDEMEADMEMVTGNIDEQQGIDHLPILKTLLQTTIPELVRIAKFHPDSEHVIRLQGKALTALNNIAWAVSIFDLSDDGNASIKKAWSPAGQAIWESVITPLLASDTADLVLATQVTSIAWAVARTLRHQTPLKDAEHRRFITLYHATKDVEQPLADEEDPFRSLGVRCIGLLGQLAADPAALELNREIGTFLITVISSLPDTPLAVAVEALNNVFDIYGDESKPCDEVFWKDGFWKHLDQAQHKLKPVVKAVNKKNQPELRTRADEAIINLNRFLAYKQKHQPTK